RVAMDLTALRGLPAVLAVFACLTAPPGPAAPDATAKEVLGGLRDFFRKTALPDGSFRPGIDPDYEGISDSAYSDLAPVVYAVILHKTFGWQLPHEEQTARFLLGRQREDGAFV